MSPVVTLADFSTKSHSTKVHRMVTQITSQRRAQRRRPNAESFQCRQDPYHQRFAQPIEPPAAFGGWQGKAPATPPNPGSCCGLLPSFSAAQPHQHHHRNQAATIRPKVQDTDLCLGQSARSLNRRHKLHALLKQIVPRPRQLNLIELHLSGGKLNPFSEKREQRLSQEIAVNHLQSAVGPTEAHPRQPVPPVLSHPENPSATRPWEQTGFGLAASIATVERIC